MIVYVPTGNVEFNAKLVALPPTRVTTLPKFTPLVLNWMAPAGVPEPGATAVTVAVKVGPCPKTEGLTEEVSAVALSDLLTVWVNVAEVLLL